MNARLKVLHQKSNVKSIKLLASTTIGRSPECDLKISSNLVSRVHCRVTVNEQAVFVEDLGSANGTFVDGESIEPHQPKLVDPGAKLVIGPAEFIVEYVSETSNTVVIRRSSDGARPALQELQNAASTSDSGLLLSTSGKSSETKPSEASTVRPRPSPVSPKPVETSRTVPPTQPQPFSVPMPALERPTPLFQKPPEESSIHKAGSSIQKAAAKAPSAPVASPPVAKVVSAKPVDAPAGPRRAELAQSQSSITKKASPSGSSSIAAPPSPPPAPEEQPFGFAEFKDTVDAELDQTVNFNLDDTVDHHPSSKDKKEKPLKSLFSMFGTKPKGVKPSSSSEPGESDSIHDPDPANVAKEPSAELPFGAGDSPSDSAAKGSDDKLDDDFQNFLRQF